MTQTIPTKFKFITNEQWSPEDNDEQDDGEEYVETPDHFWQIVRGLGWDEFRCGKTQHMVNTRTLSKAQCDMFVKYYNRHMREFMIARERVVPDDDDRIMIGSHFIALGKDHFINALNDDELVNNVHNAIAYGDFNGSIPPHWRYKHAHARPNPAN